MLLLAAIWHFVSAAQEQKPMSTEALFPLLAGGFVLFAGMFSGDYYDSRMAWFFLGLAAVEGLRLLDPTATHLVAIHGPSAGGIRSRPRHAESTARIKQEDQPYEDSSGVDAQ